MSRHPSRQQGITLIESLVAMVIFAIGILGLIGLQARAMSVANDAKYRADAAFMVNQILGWIEVSDPSQASITGFAHRAGGAVCDSNNTGNSANATVTKWRSDLDKILAGANPLAKIKVTVVQAAAPLAVPPIPLIVDVEAGVCWQLLVGDAQFRPADAQNRDGELHSHTAYKRVRFD